MAKVAAASKKDYDYSSLNSAKTKLNNLVNRTTLTMEECNQKATHQKNLKNTVHEEQHKVFADKYQCEADESKCQTDFKDLESIAPNYSNYKKIVNSFDFDHLCDQDENNSSYDGLNKIRKARLTKLSGLEISDLISAVENAGANTTGKKAELKAIARAELEGLMAFYKSVIAHVTFQLAVAPSVVAI